MYFRENTRFAEDETEFQVVIDDDDDRRLGNATDVRANKILSMNTKY